MYIFFGTTDLYGPTMPNNYDIKLRCLGTVFRVKFVLGYRKIQNMQTYDNVAKADVVQTILGMVDTWNTQFASEST